MFYCRKYLVLLEGSALRAGRLSPPRLKAGASRREHLVKQAATRLVHCPECNGTHTREVKTDGEYSCLDCDRADHESWFGVWHSSDREPYQPGVDGWDEADPPPGLLAS